LDKDNLKHQDANCLMPKVRMIKCPRLFETHMVGGAWWCYKLRDVDLWTCHFSKMLCNNKGELTKKQLDELLLLEAMSDIGFHERLLIIERKLGINFLEEMKQLENKKR